MERILYMFGKGFAGLKGSGLGLVWMNKGRNAQLSIFSDSYLFACY